MKNLKGILGLSILMIAILSCQKESIITSERLDTLTITKPVAKPVTTPTTPKDTTKIPTIPTIPVSVNTVTIDPNGNDVTGNGSPALPWKTLYKACSATTLAGTTIHVKAGTYVETSTCSLAVGVSIVGDGETSVIKSTVTGEWKPLLYLFSGTEGTNGNQSISNLKFDGQNTATGTAILVFARSNVSIHNCTFTNFFYHAINVYGHTDGTSGAPSAFGTNNMVYNNTITNCSDYQSGSGMYGSLSFGGQDGMLVYNNTINCTGRAAGHNGGCIKMLCGDGYNKDVKIHDNVLTADPNVDASSSNSWDFCIEHWNSLGGIEIYNNEIYNSQVDLGGWNNTKGSSSYSVSLHDNIIGCTSLHSINEMAIIIEGTINNSDLLIYNNTIKNVNTGIVFYSTSGATYNNIKIYYNVFDQIGIAKSGWNNTYAIGYSVSTPGSFTTDNWQIYNNVFNGCTYSGNSQTSAISLWNSSSCTFTNMFIRNNIFTGWDYAAIRDASAGAISNLRIENNDFYNNGNNNDPYMPVTPSQYTMQNNLKTDPLFLSTNDFHLQPSSKAIKAGISVGILTDIVGRSIVSNPDMGAYQN